MSLETPLTDLLGIRYPIIQAPMAFGAGGALAAAVTGGGGLGLIGGGYGEADWLEEQYQAAGNSRFGVGFITWSLAEQPHLLDAALDRQPAAIMLSFGDPAPFAPAIKDAGAKLICQVQTVADAKIAGAAGADIIVAQGTEAGGHAGQRATITLVPAVVDAVAPLPVVAAGGIADGRGLAAALVLGACGILMGTRFHATPEFLGHDKAKARIVEASGDATVQSRVVDIVRGKHWPRQFAIRTLTNDFTDRWQADEDGLAASLEAQAGVYGDAASRGDFDTAAVIAGEGVDLIDDIVPAADLVGRIADEAEAILEKMGAKG